MKKKIKISKSQWQTIGKKAGWMKTAQTIPDDGYADGGEPHTDEELDIMNKDEEAEGAKEAEWVTFTYGTTPPEIIKERTKSQAPNGYPMTIRSQDEWAVIAKAVNQGIDSHLEGFTRSTFDHKNGKCLIHPDEMTTFLRRLSENEDEGDEASGLRMAILSTLNIEEM